MKLTREDVVAVANNRYAKRAGNKLMLLIVGLIIVGFGGAFFSGESTAIRWGLCAITAICVIVVAVLMDKGQKNERRKLLREWEAETKEAVKPTKV